MLMRLPCSSITRFGGLFLPRAECPKLAVDRRLGLVNKRPLSGMLTHKSFKCEARIDPPRTLDYQAQTKNGIFDPRQLTLNSIWN